MTVTRPRSRFELRNVKPEPASKFYALNAFQPNFSFKPTRFELEFLTRSIGYQAQPSRLNSNVRPKFKTYCVCRRKTPAVAAQLAILNWASRAHECATRADAMHPYIVTMLAGRR